MNNNDKFVDSCRLLGIYNNKDVYLYMSSKYKSNSIFYSPNYYLLPKWTNAETLTFMQAVKIINFRMKHKNSDNINVKILMDMCKDAPASLRRLTPCAADVSLCCVVDRVILRHQFLLKSLTSEIESSKRKAENFFVTL